MTLWRKISSKKSEEENKYPWKNFLGSVFQPVNFTTSINLVTEKILLLWRIY